MGLVGVIPKGMCTVIPLENCVLSCQKGGVYYNDTHLKGLDDCHTERVLMAIIMY